VHASLLCVALPCTSRCLLQQVAELQSARTAAGEAYAQVSSLQQAVTSLQADKGGLAAQIKKLTAEKASLSEQLGTTAGDIDMLQVCAPCQRMVLSAALSHSLPPAQFCLLMLQCNKSTSSEWHTSQCRTDSGKVRFMP
jgi:septal ring factor EnvC (AmiA/AmiB activator)